jgi:hypothetical protein
VSTIATGRDLSEKFNKAQAFSRMSILQSGADSVFVSL